MGKPQLLGRLGGVAGKLEIDVNILRNSHVVGRLLFSRACIRFERVALAGFAVRPKKDTTRSTAIAALINLPKKLALLLANSVMSSTIITRFLPIPARGCSFSQFTKC